MKIYAWFTGSARHTHPVRARQMVREGALRAVRRARQEAFGIVPLTPPFEKVTLLRPTKTSPHRTVSRVSHPTSVIDVMNMRGEPEPVEE